MKLSISAHSPLSPAPDALSETFLASSSLKFDLNCRHELPAFSPEQKIQTHLRHPLLLRAPDQLPSTPRCLSSAYPLTNGNAGGKLPRGNLTSRIPARSFSAASR